MASSVSLVALPQASLWQQHRETLNQLYQVQRKTLQEVKQIMENEHAFPNIPLSTYETKLRDELGLRKKLKAQDWIAIHQHVAARENRGSRVYLNDVAIPQRKLRKEIARNLKRRQVPESLPLPACVSIVTPPQSPSDVLRHGSALTPALVPDVPHRLDETSDDVSGVTGLSQVSMDLTPVLDADRQNLSIVPRFQYHNMFNKTKEILASRHSSLPFMPFETIIFDERFVKLWHPLLNNLPSLQFQCHLTDAYSLGSSLLADPNIHDYGHSSTRDLEELDPKDAVELGLSSAVTFHARSPSPFENMSRNGSDLQLSTRIDPVYAFSVVMFHLANDMESRSEVSKFIHGFAQQIPWHLFEAALRLESPTVRESWGKLLDWAFVFGELYFESMVQILMKESLWIQWHGAKALTMAAWYNCYETCKRLIRCGISPNDKCNFPPGDLRDREPVARSEKYKTARDYAPSTGPPGPKQYSPLIKAVVRGNTKSVRVLLDGGADVNLRCEGYTAAGYLLLALKRGNLNRQRCLQIMQILLERGSDVHEPFREALFAPARSDRSLIPNSYITPLREHLIFPIDSPSTSFDYSDTTLLDEAYLTGDSELTELLQRYDETPENQITVRGIISNARRGIQELQAYLHTASFPRGLRRRCVQDFSLYMCFGEPKAFLAMLQAGFDPALPHLGQISIRGVKKGRFLGETISRRARGEDFVREIIANLFKHISVTSLSKDEMSFFLQKETAVKAGLVEACLRSKRNNDLQYLLDSGFDMTGKIGTVMMVEAALRENFAAVSFLQSCNVDINGTLRVGDKDCSILLLVITCLQGAMQLNGNLPSWPMHIREASFEMLGFLVRHGADVNTCRPYLLSSLGWGQLGTGGNSSKWLIDNGLNLTGLSICDIMIRRRLLSGLDGLQRLVRRNVPIFSSNEPLEDHRYFTFDTHPLAFFISLNPGPEFIHLVLGSGIDVNGTGRTVTTKTPLRAAAELNDLGLMKELLSRGALINDAECKSRYTSLQLACGAGEACRSAPFSKALPVQFDMAKHLLENGADPNLTGTCRGETPLRLALISQDPNIQVIEMLLQRRANVNAFTFNSNSFPFDESFILQDALASDSLGRHKQYVVKMLIDHGARINARWGGSTGRKLGPSALEVICNYGGPDCTDLVKLLLDEGAELSPPVGFEERDALGIACDKRNFDLIKLLIDRGANVDKKITYKALDINIIKLLLDRGIDPNPSDPKTHGPLVEAAAEGDLTMAVLLLTAGARVSIGSYDLRYSIERYSCSCPLISAVWNKRLDMVALLLGFETREEVFKDAISLARKRGNFGIMSLIQRHIDRNRPLRPEAQMDEPILYQTNDQSLGSSSVEWDDWDV